MPQFKLTAYPAKHDGRFTTIEITRAFHRQTIDCTLAELPERIKAIGQGLTSPSRDMPHVQISAYPVGRAPNGFKQFEAARKNEYLHIPAQQVTA